jgi:hypothetical protein
VLKLVPPDGQAWAIVLTASLCATALGRLVALGLGKVIDKPAQAR